jgi:hypothetical protein
MSRVRGSVTGSKSIDRKSGAVAADAGLAGTVSRSTDAALGATGPNGGALAGNLSSSGTTSVSKNVGTSADLVGTDDVGSAAGGARSAATGAVSSARDTATSTVGATRNRVASAAGTVRDRAGSTIDRARDVTGSASSSASGDLAGSVTGSSASASGKGSGSGQAQARQPQP